MHGRKIENIDLEVEPPELAQIIRKQINDLAVQYKSIKKMEEAEKKENNIVMVQLRCPKCGGSLQPTAVKNVYECKFCDTTVMMKS
jgi:predicted Zn-ribbon and HTH transcriptional regulator